MAIGIKMTGNWEVNMKKLKKLNPDVFSAAMAGQRRAARKYKKTVIGHLRKQDLDWEPLAQSTIDRKGHDKILIDTRLYINSITEYRRKYVYFVGIKPGVKYAKGVDVYKVAMWHEVKSFTTGPYRALWNPSLKEIGGPDGIRRIVQNTIEEKMKTRGWKLKRI